MGQNQGTPSEVVTEFSGENRPPARRHLLRASAAGAGLLLLKPETVFGTQANSAIELGLVGCGGRGNWLSRFFMQEGDARFVAVADVIREKLEQTRAKLNVDPSRAYLGLGAYRELMHSKLDAVVLETPPYCFPDMVAEAVDAGKHVFVAKPIAVDVPGCLKVKDAGERARGKISFLVDFQLRARPVFQEAQRRVRAGEVGDPILGQVFYYSSSAVPKPVEGLSPSAARLRNWYFYPELAGDLVVSRDIHVIDGINYFLGAHPERARGTGGRKNYPGVGDMFDHFIVTLWYPGDVHVAFSSMEWTRKFHDMCIRVCGTAGTLDAHYGGAVRITGERAWDGAEKDDTFNGGAIANVKAFLESVRNHKWLNNVTESVESNLSSILCRMAARQGRMVSWDEMLASKERFDAKLEL